MTRHLLSLSADEIDEVAWLDFVQQCFWIENNADKMAAILRHSYYCVEFEFISGSPGYGGDLFFVLGEELTGDWPLTLIRDKEGGIVDANTHKVGRGSLWGQWLREQQR